MELTVVSREIVVVGTRVLAEMTDGSLVELSIPYGVGNDTGFESRLRWKTKEAMVELARDLNAFRKAECNYTLHLEKQRIYGHGYQLRGY